MEYLQYINVCTGIATEVVKVLNLVISGIPSILNDIFDAKVNDIMGFKPCYKWNTFNTV